MGVSTIPKTGVQLDGFTQGTSYTLYMRGYGYITSSNTQLGVVLIPQNSSNVFTRTPTITSMRLAIRMPSGGYVDIFTGANSSGNEIVGRSGYTIGNMSVGGGRGNLHFDINKSSEFTGSINNIPVSVVAYVILTA
jgi:hypothetical protein